MITYYFGKNFCPEKVQSKNERWMQATCELFDLISDLPQHNTLNYLFKARKSTEIYYYFFL